MPHAHHDLDPSCVERTLPDGTVLGACLADPLVAVPYFQSEYLGQWSTEPAQPTVAACLAAVHTVIEDVDSVLGWLHTIKRTLPDDELERVLVSINRVQSTWAAATLARAALRDVRP